MLRIKNDNSMKKRLFLALLLLAGYVAQAQLVLMNPARNAEPATASSPVFRTGSNTMWWGLVADDNNRSGLGTKKAESFDAALKAAGMVAGKQVKSMKFYLRDLSVLKDIKIFFSKNLPSNLDNADYVQAIDKSTLTGGDEGNYKQGRPNVVQLTTPYTIPAEGCYVGIHFTVTSAASSAGQYPIVLYAVKNQTDGLWIRSSQSVTRWTDGNSYGTLATQLELEGEFTDNAATPKDFGKVGGSVGYPINIPLEISNMGKLAINNIDYTITTNGVDGELIHHQFASAISASGKQTLNITLPAESEPKENHLAITINKVNGQDNQAEDKVAEGTVAIVSDLYPRNVIIEEFTTESCGNCPRVAGFLHEALKDYDLSKVGAVCHHEGYYSDWLTQPCDKELTWLYNEGGGTYAPAMMFNRRAIFDSQYLQGEKDNVTIPGSAAEIKSIVNNQLQQYSNVTLNVDAAPNADSTEVTFTINGKCNNAFDKATGLLTIYMTEDSIKARRQAGAGSNYYQMHVIRYYNSSWGDPITWKGNEFTATYTITLKNEWKRNQLVFAAMVNKHNTDNKLDCPIENSACCKLGKYKGGSGIDNVTTTSNVHEVARFTIDGRRIQQAQPGINIIQMSDGSVRKVLVK